MPEVTESNVQSKIIFETTRQLKIQVDIEQNKPAKAIKIMVPKNFFITSTPLK